MDLPFDGAISAFHDNDAPADLRDLIANTPEKGIPNPDFPYVKLMGRKAYAEQMAALQIELARLQSWVKESGERVVIIFEGRDASGKGGTIKRFTENLNPRGARIVALPKPTETEAGQWYFQRYIDTLPTKGEIVFYDRSWYNRGVVEKVFGFCDDTARDRWFDQVAPFERMLVDEGIRLFKVWLTVGRATQLQRFLARERDPLKQWKLSWIDIEGLKRWGEYSNAISETLHRTHLDYAPWVVVRGDDKRRARLNAIRAVLQQIPYARRDDAAINHVDTLIAGGPELWHG